MFQKIQVWLILQSSEPPKSANFASYQVYLQYPIVTSGLSVLLVTCYLRWHCWPNGGGGGRGEGGGRCPFCCLCMLAKAAADKWDSPSISGIRSFQHWASQSSGPSRHCIQEMDSSIMYTVNKRLAIFPSPTRMSLTRLSLGGNNGVIYKLLVSLVNDIPAGEGNIEKLFLRCKNAIPLA